MKDEATEAASSPASAATEETRMLSQQDRQIPLQLAGRTYTLDPSRFDRDGVTAPIVNALKAAALTVMLPVAALGGCIFASFMYFAPIHLKNKLDSWWLPFICGKLDEKFAPERKILLSDCNGRVLDVGSGGGAYMRYFERATAITALEPVQELHKTIRKKAASYGIHSDRLTVLAMDSETFVKQRSCDEELYDWVILGNVLCEVENPETTLEAVDQLLKPGVGRVYFSEHVACPAGSWERRLQEWINPVWYTISNGCSINRDSLHSINDMANWKVIHWTYKTVKVGIGPFVLGLALKEC